jgi:predicted peptidase
MSYKPGQPRAAVLFLHGKFQAGNNGTGAMSEGIGPALARDPSKWDTIVVVPQSPSNWDKPEQYNLAIAVLDEVQKNYSIDPARVSLTGLSTGGQGVWILGAKYPDRFNRLAPMCAFREEELAPKLTKKPVWAFHNRLDPFVSHGGSKSMVEKISAAGGKARLTSYNSNLNPHDCWSYAYADEEFIRWIQSK